MYIAGFFGDPLDIGTVVADRYPRLIVVNFDSMVTILSKIGS